MGSSKFGQLLMHSAAVCSGGNHITNEEYNHAIEQKIGTSADSKHLGNITGHLGKHYGYSRQDDQTEKCEPSGSQAACTASRPDDQYADADRGHEQNYLYTDLRVHGLPYFIVKSTRMLIEFQADWPLDVE